MKHRVLFLLTFIVCLARLLPQSLPGHVSTTLPDNLALICRAKQPFPFTAIQLVKKRLSSPPADQQVDFAQGPSVQSPAPGPAVYFMDARPVSAPAERCKAALLPAIATGCSTSGIERNVFHPPPSGQTHHN